MPNTEDIEAKLCAYVDGELDEAGRGEIERHLTTNPQHRKLIAELTEQRDMLRALPRARAPLDVAETLNAQLERAALLNQEDDWRDQPIRLSRWPQIRAAAAVLLLVFGLAAVVYYVVPSPNRPNPTIVVSDATVSSPRTTHAESDVVPTTGPSLEPRSTVLTGTGAPDREFMASSDQQRRALLALIPETMRDTPISNAQSPQFEVMSNAFASSAAARSRGQVKVVVAAADVGAAQRRVRDYFNERGVELEPRFEQAAMPQALSIGPSQRVALGSRQQQPTDDKLREQVKLDAAPEQPAEQKDAAQPAPAPAPAPGGAAGGAEGRADEEQTFMARLPRREVAELSRGISNQLAGRTVQVMEETTGDRRRSDESSADFEPIQIGNWSSLFPWLAKSQAADAAHERRFAFVAPATQPGADADADEEVDVLIVVRSDPSLQLQQGQQALTDTAAAGGAARTEQPTTAPATGPSSQ